MLEVKKNVENEEVVETMEEEVTESKGFLAKAKDGIKKNAKKIAVGAVIGGCVLIGYALGHKSNDENDLEAEDSSYEDNVIDIEDYSEKEAE